MQRFTSVFEGVNKKILLQGEIPRWLQDVRDGRLPLWSAPTLRKPTDKKYRGGLSWSLRQLPWAKYVRDGLIHKAKPTKAALARTRRQADIRRLLTELSITHNTSALVQIWELVAIGGN